MAIWLRILIAIPMLVWGVPAAWIYSGTGVLDFRSQNSALLQVPLPVAGALVVGAAWLLVAWMIWIFVDQRRAAADDPGKIVAYLSRKGVETLSVEAATRRVHDAAHVSSEVRPMAQAVRAQL